ncbi:MAG TPA: hypothetical protein VG388_00595 [Solirubrobacteraceae bacterium]|jgi:hypothetical protein|nr:hypothetical protein [Solirubrobacteraceae bacterium]
MSDKDEQVTAQEDLEGTEETTEDKPEVEGHLKMSPLEAAKKMDVEKKR